VHLLRVFMYLVNSFYSYNFYFYNLSFYYGPMEERERREGSHTLWPVLCL